MNDLRLFGFVMLWERGHVGPVSLELRLPVPSGR